MPNYKVIDPANYRLRHVGLAADLYPSGGAPTAVAVGNQNLVPRPLPGDWNDGNWTGRVSDAGEFEVTFPNANASDGPMWKQRFKTDGLVQFLEILADDEPEFVGVITKVKPDRGSVVVSGFDGWHLLRKAYERDRTVVISPRDLIEDYTQVPVMDVCDDFPGTALAANWAGTSVVSVSGSRVHLQCTSGVNTDSNIASNIASAGGPGKRWSVCMVGEIKTSSTAGGLALFYVQITQSPGQVITLGIQIPNAHATFNVQYDGSGANFMQIPWPSDQFSGEHTFLIECDGRFMTGSIDGKIVGQCALDKATVTSGTTFTMKTGVQITAGANMTADVNLAYQRSLRDFLMRGTAKGDYVLPGGSSAYPTGGLRGYWYNDIDLAASTIARGQRLGSRRAPAIDRLDASLNNPTSPRPYCDTLYYSVRFEGAVYLPLAAVPGTWTFTLDVDDGGRVWVGKTRFGDQVIDHWGPDGTFTGLTGSFVDTALGSKDGWYPIVIEAYQQTGGSNMVLRFTPPGAGSYTDPGGTSITKGSAVVIPSTSLSPLGCVHARLQGQSHFDIVQKTIRDFGYQASVLPRTLESGTFPGELLPVSRVGQDYDISLEPDDSDARVGALDYSSTTDGTDQVGTLRGNGAGVQTGDAGQVTSEAISDTFAKAGLFELQGWTDASEIGLAKLLQNRLSRELGLRLSPWQEVAATPKAFPQLAGGFPVVLPPVLSAMKWRPGDGVRLSLPDVNVDDSVPRQIVQFTRQFTPAGRTGNQASFRNRPKGAQAVVRENFYSVSRLQRAYQTQIVTLQSQFTDDVSVAAGAFGNFVQMILGAENVRYAEARMYLGTGTGGTVDLEINGTLRGTALGGPWPAGGLTFTLYRINITPYLQQAGANNATQDPRLFARLKNTTAGALDLALQLFVDVLR